jgi:hypothetical protein
MIPVIDFTRPGNLDFQTVEDLGTVTATDDANNRFIDLPVRLCLHYGEPVIEVGPYSLDATDVEKIREMLASFSVTERDVPLEEYLSGLDTSLATVTPIRIVAGEHRP